MKHPLETSGGNSLPTGENPQARLRAAAMGAIAKEIGQTLSRLSQQADLPAAAVEAEVAAQAEQLRGVLSLLSSTPEISG